jgi:hypothetical protein
MTVKSRLSRLEARATAHDWRLCRRIIEWPEDSPGQADRLADELVAQGFNVILRRVVEVQQKALSL